MATSEHALAAQLQAAWDDETAAVYADLLTARGDPHGELIALDLALAQEHRAELVDRKRELVEAWLPAKHAGWIRRPHRIRRGLLFGLSCATTPDCTLADNLAAMLAVAGDRLGGLALTGDADELAAGLDVLAARRRPWLAELALTLPEDAPPVDRARWARVIEATPHLHTITLTGTGMVVSPIHPAVETLRVVGPAIAVGAHPIANVTELAVEFARRDRLRPITDDEIRALAGLVNPRAFPAVRVLDLSANEATRVPPARVVAFVDAIEQVSRFARLRLPSIAETGALAPWSALLDRCPALEVEVARMYTTLEATHPRLHLPAPRAWPAAAHGRDALEVALPLAAHGPELALSSLIDNLEDQFDGMSPVAREAWLALWRFLDDLPWEDDRGETVYRPFSAASLLEALEALDGNWRCDEVAMMIRTAALPAGAQITISRYWGW